MNMGVLAGDSDNAKTGSGSMAAFFFCFAIILACFYFTDGDVAAFKSWVSGVF